LAISLSRAVIRASVSDRAVAMAVCSARVDGIANGIFSIVGAFKLGTPEASL
jgi:hypothetical protein